MNSSKDILTKNIKYWLRILLIIGLIFLTIALYVYIGRKHTAQMKNTLIQECIQHGTTSEICRSALERCMGRLY